MSAEILFYIIIAIIILNFVIDKILDAKNAEKFRDPIPEELKDIYDTTTYNKSQEYKLTNYRFDNGYSAFMLVITLLFFFLDGFYLLDEYVRSISEDPIMITLLFFGIIMFASDLIGLPFSIYRTFVIEEKFGFNKTKPSTFIFDRIKGWILMVIVGGGLLALITWIYLNTGSYFWLLAWGVLIVFTLFTNLFYSRLIVPLFNKQTPLEEGELKEKIASYAKSVGFNLSKIFVIDGSKRSTKANAYFSGFGSEKRVTLYDTLINDLEQEEIVAVLAHEVGHYKKKHIIYNLIISILLSGFTLFLLSLFIDSPLLSEALGVSQPSFHIGLIAFGLLYSPISTFTGLLMNMLSRKFEYQADDYAKSTYMAEPMINSLKKLAKNNLVNLTPHPTYVFVHYSHPPLLERIRNLKK